MPSRAQRRRAHKDKLNAAFQAKQQGVSVSSEPRIYAEDVGKLVDLGVDQDLVDRLRIAGVRCVRDIPFKLQSVQGATVDQFDRLKKALERFGVAITVPAALPLTREQSILPKPIATLEDFGLHRNICELITSARIATVEQLAQKLRDDIYIPYIGPVREREIRTALHKADVRV